MVVCSLLQAFPFAEKLVRELSEKIKNLHIGTDDLVGACHYIECMTSEGTTTSAVGPLSDCNQLQARLESASALPTNTRGR